MAYDFVNNIYASDYVTIHSGAPSFWIAALQVNLGLTVDGVMEPGKVTENTLKDYQKAHGLVVDGIAGPATQRVLVLDKMTPVGPQFKIPPGLMMGIAEGESGDYIGCCSPSSGGLDIGTWQDHQTWADMTNESIQRALNILALGLDTGAKIRRQKDIFVSQAGCQSTVNPDQAAWMFAVLFHNWERAAIHFAAGDIDSWTYHAYNSAGILKSYKMSDPAYWVQQASGGRLNTGYEWADYYIKTKIHYVKKWTV